MTGQSFKGYRCLLGNAIFLSRVTWTYAYSPFNSVTIHSVSPIIRKRNRNVKSKNEPNIELLHLGGREHHTYFRGWAGASFPLSGLFLLFWFLFASLELVIGHSCLRGLYRHHHNKNIVVTNFYLFIYFIPSLQNHFGQNIRTEKEPNTKPPNQPGNN